MPKFRNINLILITFFLLCFCSVTPVAALDVVATTSVLWDPAQAIGGEHVNAIYVADPTICPHLQGDIIDARIQMNKDFIASADLFLAHDSSMDSGIVMPAIEDFMQANGYGTVSWTVPDAADWNTPEKAKVLAEDIRDILIAADPANTTSYEANYNGYCDRIDAADLTDEEKLRIEGQDVIVMVWQQEAAEQWLGLNVVSIFGPDFYMGGQYTPAKIVDDINANPDKYRNVRYVIENMQSGELAKGIEEALNDNGIGADRVIFTNFPKSLDGVESIPGVLEHNKEIVTPEDRPLNVVATTSVLWDPAQAIGGEHVNAIYVADPAICPHMQGDIIDARIQMNKDFIASADLFLAHDSSMDSGIVMPAIEDFMQANGYGTVSWTVPDAADWNTPEKAKVLAEDIKDILIEEQPWNADAFEGNYDTYCDEIDAADVSDDERSLIEGQDVVVMVWQQEAAEQWLGLNVVSIFGPEFYMGGQYTPAKIVDDINANPDKYQNVQYVIENMQSGELAKGIEEALNDNGIGADRVIFTNFPKSLDGVESIPGVLDHNKEVVMASPNTGDGGSGGSSADVATGLCAGEETEFCFDSDVLCRIVLVPEDDMASVVMNVQETTYPTSGATAPENATYRYLDISPSPALEGACNATIEFTVDASWMTAQGAGPLDIALLHWHDGAWERLETEYLGTNENGDYLYRAYCTGFSPFAVSFEVGAAVDAETGTTEESVNTTATTAAAETVTATATATTAPVSSTTTATTPTGAGAETTTPQPAPLPIALALGAFALVVVLKRH